MKKNIFAILLTLIAISSAPLISVGINNSAYDSYWGRDTLTLQADKADDTSESSSAEGTAAYDTYGQILRYKIFPSGYMTKP